MLVELLPRPFRPYIVTTTSNTQGKGDPRPRLVAGCDTSHRTHLNSAAQLHQRAAWPCHMPHGLSHFRDFPSKPSWRPGPILANSVTPASYHWLYIVTYVVTPSKSPHGLYTPILPIGMSVVWALFLGYLATWPFGRLPLTPRLHDKRRPPKLGRRVHMPLVVNIS